MADEQAVPAESAPVQTLEAEPKPVEGAEPEPAKEPEPQKDLGAKGVEELKTQRRKRQEAEQEAAYWRGVAEANKKPEVQVRQPESPPVLEKFESYDDFLVAKAKWEFSQEQTQRDKNREEQRIRDTYNERFRKAVEKHPDLPEVVQSIVRNPNIPQNPAMAQAIMESEVGPEITYHLAQNPLEAIRIASLNPFAAAREIGKLEMKLTTAPKAEPQKISQAPEPIKVVGTKGIVSAFDYEKSSMDDFMKKRNTEAPPGRR